MLILLTLLLLSTLTYAADDHRSLVPFSSSSSSYSNAMSLSASSSTNALKTPEDYLQQLARNSAELEKHSIAGEHDFVLDINNNHVIASLLRVEKYIDNHFAELKEYYLYFTALAQNTLLSDSEKIQKKYVSVPPIAQFNTQEDKDEKLRQAILIHGDFNYHIRRLLFAALIHAGSSSNLKAFFGFGDHNICYIATCCNDISLLQNIVNSPAFDPTQHTESFFAVKSIKAAQLLIKKNIKLPEKIDSTHPFIRQCNLSEYYDLDTDLINAYLEHILRTDKNEKGKLCLKVIVSGWKNSYGKVDQKIKLIELFLNHNCPYNDALKADIIETIANSEVNDQEKDNVREQIIELFVQHEGKNTKPAQNK